MKTSHGSGTFPAGGSLAGILVWVLAGLVGTGVLLELTGCGSDHTAGVVYDDGSDNGPAPTLTPPGASGALLGRPATPTATPLPR